MRGMREYPENDTSHSQAIPDGASQSEQKQNNDQILIDNGRLLGLDHRAETWLTSLCGTCRSLGDCSSPTPQRCSALPCHICSLQLLARSARLLMGPAYDRHRGGAQSRGRGPRLSLRARLAARPRNTRPALRHRRPTGAATGHRGRRTARPPRPPCPGRRRIGRLARERGSLRSDPTVRERPPRPGVDLLARRQSAQQGPGRPRYRRRGGHAGPARQTRRRILAPSCSSSATWTTRSTMREAPPNCAS